MMRAGVAAGLLLAVAGDAHGKAPPAKTLPRLPPPPPHVWVKPAPPLPMLPSVARVRVEAARDRVVVLEEVTFPRGDWVSGGLDLHVAFGAPGTPIAVDAQLGVASPGAGEPRGEDAGEPVKVEPVVGRVGGAAPLLGKPQMAGVVVRVKESQLRRAYAASEIATLRVRSLLAAPAADPSGRRDVVVRLGAPGGTPLTLGRVQVVSLEPRPWITRAEASLCGAEADPWPLTVSVLPKPTAGQSAPAPSTIAPAMAVRHASDDLCVRWWAGD
jgi:hypothetical protein